jgi:hypothetical protein
VITFWYRFIIHSYFLIQPITVSNLGCTVFSLIQPIAVSNLGCTVFSLIQPITVSNLGCTVFSLIQPITVSNLSCTVFSSCNKYILRCLHCALAILTQFLPELNTIYLNRLYFVLNFLHVRTGDVCVRTALHNRRPSIDEVKVICISYIYHFGILMTKIICFQRRINVSILNISTVAVFMLLTGRV